ncbi:putative phosphatidylinositol anchor biosynthesis protein PIGW/GWT1 [Dioscorea sansibarensis]
MDLIGKPLNPNKHLKEEFVSNLTGSSMLEIAALSAIVPALVVIRQWSSFGHAENWRSSLTTVAMDFICVVLPVLLIFTVLAEWVYIFAFLLLVLLLICILSRRSSVSHFKEESQFLSSIRATILSYRVSVVVVTCLCILAVDFRIFPRRYAKTETYGTSLMDLGVGSFVVANALVSRQARYALPVLKSAFRSVIPLAVLGFGRLILTTGADYQVHVGEYGVHWNFFFTLAGVVILASLFNIHPKYCGIFGLLILGGYQTCLTSGLSGYLLSNGRAMDIISQNKEGIFSIFGYWGLYLLGVNLGYSLFFGNVASAKSKNFQWARLRVCIFSILMWLLTLVLNNHVERVSRRMCNFAYVTFVLAQNFQVLSILMLSDFIPGRKPLELEAAFNQNLLGSFLLANILTGVVNLYVDTLSASSITALGILLGYAFALAAIVCALWFSSLKLAL